MRLAELKHDYESGDFAEAQSVGFSPEFAPRIFDYLTKSLYSRPAESMFRELCCNALDERPHAGGRAFDVILPSDLSPELVIRDYGRGMAHDFIMSRLMSIGDSTKRGDNSAIGGFGLGCKTPFAVTDQFSIVVYRGDVAQTYLIDKQGGLPRVQTSPELCAPLVQHETGTEFRVPVSRSEQIKYRDIAARILSQFPPHSFEVRGLTVSLVSHTYESQTYAILLNRDASTYAKLGPIAYRLDFEALGADAPQITKGLELRFPIGALGLNPSRESLEYTPETIAAVCARLHEIKAEHLANFEARLASASTLWGAQVAFCDLHKNAGALRPLMPAKAMWQGHTIEGVDIHAGPPLEVDDVDPVDGKPIKRKVYLPQPVTYGGYYRRKMTGQEGPVKYTPSSYSERPQWLFALDDTNGKRIAARAQVAHERTNKTVVIVTQEIVDRYTLPNVRKMSEFVPPITKAQKNRADGKRRARIWGNYNYKTSSNWRADDVELADGGLYVASKKEGETGEAGLERAQKEGELLKSLPWLKGERLVLASSVFLRDAAKIEDAADDWTEALPQMIRRALDLHANADFQTAMRWAEMQSELDAGALAFIEAHGAADDKACGLVLRIVQQSKPVNTWSYDDLESVRKLIEAGHVPPISARSRIAVYHLAMKNLHKARPVFGLLIETLRHDRVSADQASIIRRALEVKGN